MNDGTNVENNYLPYLDVSNTVSIITTTLSSGVGFVIGQASRAWHQFCIGSIGDLGYSDVVGW